MPRFVVLTHDHPEWHWDFMLEFRGALRTWRLTADPLSPGSIPATPLADHRLDYLDYEGPVSGNRGTVRRVDCGEYEIISEAADRLEIALRGEKLRGHANMITEADGSVIFKYSATAAIKR